MIGALRYSWLIPLLAITLVGCRSSQAQARNRAQCGLKADGAKNITVAGVSVNPYAYLAAFKRIHIKRKREHLCPAVRVGERAFLTSRRCLEAFTSFDFQVLIGRRFKLPGRPQHNTDKAIREPSTYDVRWTVYKNPSKPSEDPDGSYSFKSDIAIHVSMKAVPMDSLDWLDTVCLGPEEDNIDKLKSTPLKMICGPPSFTPGHQEEHDVMLVDWPSSNITFDNRYETHRAIFSGPRCNDINADGFIVTKNSPVRLIASSARYDRKHDLIRAVDLASEMREQLEAGLKHAAEDVELPIQVD